MPPSPDSTVDHARLARRQALHVRDKLGVCSHIRGLLQTADRFDESCGLPSTDDRGREAPELVTYLLPGKGVVR